MTTKRIIFEQSDDDKPQPSLPGYTPDNFTAFSDGFSEGMSIKGLGCSLLILAGIIWVIWLIV